MKQKPIILVAEDEKPISSAITLKLKKEGFEVICAYDGEDALAKIKKEKFDLILLDLVMPKKDGFEVLEEVKNANIKVPIIVSSNLSQREDTEKALSLGAVGYFIKSETSISEVILHVKKALNL
jgi:two-component system response regulator VicR